MFRKKKQEQPVQQPMQQPMQQSQGFVNGPSVEYAATNPIGYAVPEQSQIQPTLNNVGLDKISYPNLTYSVAPLPLDMAMLFSAIKDGDAIPFIELNAKLTSPKLDYLNMILREETEYTPADYTKNTNQVNRAEDIEIDIL